MSSSYELEQFELFESTVVGPIHRFWLDHDPTHLAAASAVVGGLVSSLPSTCPDPSSQVISITGWTTRRFGYRFDRRILVVANPHYDIQLRRYHRPDVPRGRRTDGFRLGFELRATAEADSPGFVFGLRSPVGELVPLPGSSSESVAAAAAINPTVTGASVGIHPPRGNIDKIQHYPLWADDEASTWFSALVHRNPLEMLELARIGTNARFAAAATAMLSTYPATARWADRMSLASDGAEGGSLSDLEKVSVSRVPAHGEQGGVTVPELVRTGSVVVARPGLRRMPTPDPEWLQLEGAVVQNGGTVTVGQELIVYEHSADPVLDFVSGQGDSLFATSAAPDVALLSRNPRAPEAISEAILLGGRNDFNWFHWLVEYLPRVLSIDLKIGQDVPLLVTDRVPATGIEALRSLSSRRIVSTDAGLAQPVGVLHVMPPPVQVIDSTRIPWNEGLAMDPVPLVQLRSRFLESRSGPATRKVFLRRSSAHRGLLNEAEIAIEAERQGLEILDPSTLTWEEQLDLFSQTSLLVGASGAVMANYLFLQPGTRILALTSSALADFVLPAALAEIAGAQFTYLVGPPSSTLDSHNVRNSWLHSDFSVDEEDFRRVLSAMNGS